MTECAKDAGGTVFRPAQADDLPQVSELFFGAVRRMRKNGIEQWDEIYPDRNTLRTDIRKGQMFLLTENGQTAAAVVLNREQPPEYRAVGWFYRPRGIAVIHRLCVGAELQGRGYGKKTLRLSEEFLRGKGCRCIRLDAFPQNTAAIKMYESCGYRRAGKVRFRKGVFYCYEKPLPPVR